MRFFIHYPSLIILVALAVASCSEPEIVSNEPVTPPPSSADQPPCSSTAIEGYCNKMSFHSEETVHVFLLGAATLPDCGLKLYTINGELILTVPAAVSSQVNPPNDVPRDGMGFHLATSFKVPSDLKSGVYLIENKIPFIVKPSDAVDLLVLYPSNTANAYCTVGGKSLYTSPRATELSFRRTMPLQAFSIHCLLWFASQNHFNVGFIADSDMDGDDWLSLSNVLVVVGHSEYWTRAGRNNFDRFIDSGRNAVVLSGNTMWWQVRYSEDEDRSRLICYKSWDDDPNPDPLLKTSLWNDTRLSYPTISSVGADFNLGGYGLRADNGWDGYKIARPESPLLEGTGLQLGDILRCPTTEYDGAPIAGWDELGNPVPDLQRMGVEKAEIIGFDKGFRGGETHGTFIAFQRRASSGVIVNVGSTDWCSFNGMGSAAAGDRIKLITLNALRNLLEGRTVFSE